MFWRSLAAMLAIVCVLVTARADDPAAPSATPSAPAVPAADPTPSPAALTPPAAGDAAGPVTEAEAQAFAESVTKAFRAGLVDDISALIDWNALADRATYGVPVDEQFRREFTQGFVGVQRAPESWAGRLAAASASGARFELLRLRESDSRRYAVFRLRPLPSGITYNTFELHRSADGQVRAIDVYLMVTGDWMSQTARSGYIPAAAAKSADVMQIVKPSERTAAENIKQIAALRDLYSRGRFVEVTSAYRQLPPEAQELKPVLLMYMLASQQIDPDAFSKALASLREKYPRDLSGDSHAIDYFAAKGQLDKAIECLARMDKAVGGDPFLTAMTANLLLRGDRLQEARAAADKAVRADPSLKEAWLVRFQAAVELKTYADAVRWLDAIHKRFHEEPAGLGSAAPYAGLVKSSEYIAWRAKNPPPDVVAQALAVSQTPISEADVRRIVAQFEAAVARQDVQGIDALVDWRYLAAQAMQGLKVRDSFRYEFVQGARPSAAWSIGQLVAPDIRAGANYQLLRVYQRQDQWQAVMRLLSPQGQVNYHLLSFVRLPSERVAIGNVYVFSLGESFVQQMRTSVALMAPALAHGVDSLKPGQAPAFDALQESTRLAQAGKPREALAALDKLPDSMRHSKLVLVRRARISMTLGAEPYAAAVAELQKAFPQDPVTLLGQLDVAAARKDHAQTIEVARALDRLVGGDPFLNLVVGSAYFELGDFRAARQEAEAAVNGGFKSAFAYQAIALAAAMEGNTAVALNCLDKLVSTYGIRADQTEQLFADANAFRESPAYQDWLKKHASAATEEPADQPPTDAPPAAEETAAPSSP